MGIYRGENKASHGKLANSNLAKGVGRTWTIPNEM